MIYLKVFIVTKMKSGKKVLFHPKVLAQWKNEFLYECKYDLLDPIKVKKFLKEEFRLANGKRLPFESTFGEEIVYTMYFFGTPKELTEKAYFYSGGKKTRYLSLFPGYPGDDDKFRDENGKIKVKSVVKFGSIK